MYDDDCPAAHEAEMTLDTLRTLPEGRYRMRVTEDDPSLQFPPGFSFRQSGKLFVLFPSEEANQTDMGVALAPSDVTVDPDLLPDNYADPDWLEDRRIHNWRNHVPEYVRAIWLTFPDNQRQHLAAWAEELARAEEWE